MFLVLYGSVSGQAEDFADVIFNKLRKRSVEVSKKPFGESSLEEISNATTFVVCSTTGDGELPPNCQPLWQKMLNKSLNTQLTNNMFFFGIGSTAYTKFNWAIKKLSTRFTQLGAHQPILRSEADIIGPVSCDEVFDKWSEEVFKFLDHKYTLVERDGLLPPTNYWRVPTNLEVGKLTSKKIITAEAYHPEVRQLQFDFDWDLCPGDIINLYPTNDTKVVDALIQAQNYDPDQVMTLQSWLPTPLTLRDLLTHHLDLNCVPTRSFFDLAQHFCSNPNHAERMQEFSKDVEDYYDYCTRPVRSTIEVILEFDSLKIPLDYLCDLLKPIRPRQFSLSSASIVEITAANVKYRTGLRRIRRGLCSQFIEKIEVGDQVYASLEKHSFKINSDSKLILVATGTGIAPIKAILEQEYTSKPVLIYGCRYADKDLLYPELALKAETHLAISRGAENKQYVQHVIPNLDLDIDIENSTIVVCGSSGSMPQQVKLSFLNKLKLIGFSSEDSELLFKIKEREGEYIQETW